MQIALQQILVKMDESNTGPFSVHLPFPVGKGGKGFDPPCLGRLLRHAA